MEWIKTLSLGKRLRQADDGNAMSVETVTASKTLTVEDSGKTFLVATDALVITLPATVAGVEYTFINTGADDHNIITISPVAADGIAGTIILASSVVVRAGTVDTDLVNTKSGANFGDSVTIRGTGTTGVSAWIILHSTGIWA
jgi:hypothetical protein